ncbi:MAG: hypothetical protein Kow001_03210 [Acidobacteriota bacterium]
MRLGRRVLWYTLSAILLLSLPTFSDLRPRVGGQITRLMEGIGFSRSPAGTQAVRPVADARWPAPSVAGGGGFGESGFVGSAHPFREAINAATVGPQRARSERRMGFPVPPPRPATAGTQSAPAEGGPRASGGRAVAPPGANLVPELLGELSRLERDYDALASTLLPASAGSRSGFFGSSALANPFAEALFGGGGGGGTDPPAGDGGNGSGGENSGGGTGGNGGNGSGGSGGGQTPGGSDSNPPPPPPNDPGSGDSEPEPADSSNFLVLGPYGGNPDTVAFLGVRRQDGTLLLDNGLELNLFSAVVGPGRPAFIFEAGRQVVTGDVQQDGVTDLFVTLEAPLGTAVSGHRVTGGNLQQWMFGFFLYDRVVSFALFDYDGDGREEFVAISARNSNLIVFRLRNGELEYLRELSLPLEPGVVAVSRDLIRRDQYQLQVFDRSLKNSVTFDSRFPGVYSFARPSGFRSAYDLAVPQGTGDRVRQFRLLTFLDRMVLTELVGGQYRMIGSFYTGGGVPTVLVGDFLADGTQRLVFLP